MSNDRLTFADCVLGALANDELVANFDRLTGRNLGRRGSPLELAIDEASGRLADDFEAFVGFVLDMVWERLPAEVRAEG
jgi:hypothetical protein